MILIKNYSLNDELLTNELLLNYIDKFWVEVFNENKENHILLLCRVQFSDTEQGYRTLGHLVKVNYEDKELFHDYLSARLSILSDSYVTHPICQMSFSYVVKAGKTLDDDRTLLLQDYSDKDLRSHNFNNMKLPITLDPHKYGEVIVSNIIEEDSTLFVRYIVVNGNKTYKIDVHDMFNKVTILGDINLTWEDRRIYQDDRNYFMRVIKKSTIYFLDGEIILRKKEIPAKAFRKLSVEPKLNNEIRTFDIETTLKDNKISPYLIDSYDGRHHIDSLNDNEDQLFKEFFDKLVPKLDKGSITYFYAHNLSTFDGVLILRHLFKIGEVKPLIHNGKILTIKLIIKGDKPGDTKTLNFKDSYLTLPASLRNLGKAFNVETSKGHFPFNLQDINYNGEFPPFEYWTDISHKEWSALKNNHGKRIWNFKEESTKYCKQDCEALYQVVTKFNELIFNKFKLNIHKSLTGPALAMRIYKTHFMPKNTIYQLLGQIEFDIRKSYIGGAVDVFIPHNIIDNVGRVITKNEKGKYKVLYYYDVNSLYPFIMANTLLPIGKPIAFDGNIRKVEPNAYGYFYCKINSPHVLEHPLINRRIKTNNGMRTIAGLGSWEGWIYSEEIDNAKKYGYKFDILKGYQFERGEIFKDYVETLYNLRLEYPKTHPMNFIAKILMNSLYGKFGMKMENTEVMVFDCSDPTGIDVFNNTFEVWAESIIDIITIDKYKILVRNSLFAYKYDEKLDLYHGMDINIAIASAITAGARVHMSIFKNNPNFKLYYTDTDSIVIDKEIPAEFVGNKLGQLKLEHIIKRAIFLAPKVYGIENENGDQIIKIKGATKAAVKDLTIELLQGLLIENSDLELKQFKWFKKVLKSDITVKEAVYKLQATSNKRRPVYINENGLNIFSSTIPYNYNEL